MRTRHVAIMVLLGVTLCWTTAYGAQNILLNGSMEEGQAFDPFVPDGWTSLPGNVERSAEANLVPTGDGHALKAFGDGTNTNTGAFQDHPASPGQSVTVSWSNFSKDFDKLSGTGVAGVRVEFLGFFGNILSFAEKLDFDETDPANTWVADSIGPLVAPASTAKVRVFCKLGWSGAITGAVFWDDVQITVDAVAVTDNNGDFETAGPPLHPGIAEWTGFGSEGGQSTDVASNGIFSLKMDTTEQFSGRWQRMGEVVAGDHLLLKAKVLHPSSDPVTGTEVKAGIKLEFESSVPSVPPVENLAIDSTSPQDTWTLVEISTTGLIVPPEITTAKVVMIYVGDDTTSNGRVFFDSAACYLNGNTATNLLSNPSFESGTGGGITDWGTFNTPGKSEATKSCFEVTAHIGGCTARANGTAVAGAFQEVALGGFGGGPGDTIDVSAYLLVSSTDPLAAAAKAGVKVEWISGSVPPNIDIIPNPNNPVILDENSPTDTWIDVAIDFTMPAGTGAIAKFVNIVAFAGGATSGTVYFDNCEAVVLNRFDGADSDGDSDEDLYDFSQFQMCFGDAGGSPTQLKWNCTVFDSNDDDTIDLTDYAFFAPRLTGP